MKKFNNGEFNLKNLNQEVELYGWVLKKRNLGGLMKIEEKRKIQQVAERNTLFVTLPKLVTAFLNLQRGQKLIFKKENERIYIEGEKNVR